MENLDTLRHQINVSRGMTPPDLLLWGGKIVNIFSGEIYQANVAICNNMIAGIGDNYIDGLDIYNVEGLYLIPGLIDAHVHIESSMLAPHEYAKAVIPHGTTTIICDPHEIANVMGKEGIKYILEASKNIPLNLFVTASSCVPSTGLETSGAAIFSKDIEEILHWDRVIGLAEVMNVPDVLDGNTDVLEKILIARKMGHPIDGHAPSLTGKDLNTYIGLGIGSDHESTTRNEALEKLRLGMYVMIREGSAARNLEELYPIVSPATYSMCMLVSDDRHPGDLLKEGHMDHLLRKGIQLGLDPIMALSMVTINPARAFMLKGLGALAPGYKADIVAVNNLKEFKVHTVIKDGKVVVKGERLMVDFPYMLEEKTRETVRVKEFNIDRLKIKVSGNRIRVIELIPGQIYTKHIVEEVSKERDGEVKTNPEKDLLKIAVIERHHATGNIGLGFVRGFGMKHGAIGSSVAHDSHNIIVIGTNDRDIFIAAQKIMELGGGHVVVSGGEILGSLSLPIAGLLSDKSLEELVFEEERLLQAARGLGVRILSPFIKLSFLALPVIPELKITDKGLVDVNRFELVGLEP